MYSVSVTGANGQPSVVPVCGMPLNSAATSLAPGRPFARLPTAAWLFGRPYPPYHQARLVRTRRRQLRERRQGHQIGQVDVGAGIVRRQVGQPLEAGQVFLYDVQARWIVNGQPVRDARTLAVEAGKRFIVDFTR